MKTLLLLIICLALSLFQIEHFVTKRSNLFLDRVSSQTFNYQYNYLYFSVDGQQMKIYNDKPESLQVLMLDSIYSSSKAVYKTPDGKYMGIVLLDSSIYMTKSTDSILTMNFNVLYFLGVQEKRLI